MQGSTHLSLISVDFPAISSVISCRIVNLKQLNNNYTLWQASTRCCSSMTSNSLLERSSNLARSATDKNANVQADEAMTEQSNSGCICRGEVTPPADDAGNDGDLGGVDAAAG